MLHTTVRSPVDSTWFQPLEVFASSIGFGRTCFFQRPSDRVPHRALFIPPPRPAILAHVQGPRCIESDGTADGITQARNIRIRLSYTTLRTLKNLTCDRSSKVDCKVGGANRFVCVCVIRFFMCSSGSLESYTLERGTG